MLHRTLHSMPAAPKRITGASVGNPAWLTRFPDRFLVSNILKLLSTTPIYLGSLHLGRELPWAHKSSQRSWLASDMGKEKYKHITAKKIEKKKD